MGELVAPAGGLPVAILQGGEDAAGPVGVAHVTDGSLDAALLVAGADLAGTRLEVIVRGQLQQAGIEAHLRAAPFQHGALKVVVQKDARRAAEEGQGAGMAVEEVLGGLIEEKLQIKRTRPGEGHDEAGELAAGASDRDGTEGSLVHLGLLAGEDAQPGEGLGGARAQAGH